jgi:hypothetical protein
MKVQNCYWGNPKKSDYDLILDYYSATKINSNSNIISSFGSILEKYRSGIRKSC